MARVEAKVKPELLVWARTSARMAQGDAAARAKVRPARLSEWEAGDSRPSVPELQRLAAVYKRPLAVFYLP